MNRSFVIAAVVASVAGALAAHFLTNEILIGWMPGLFLAAAFEFVERSSRRWWRFPASAGASLAVVVAAVRVERMLTPRGDIFAFGIVLIIVAMSLGGLIAERRRERAERRA